MTTTSNANATAALASLNTLAIVPGLNVPGTVVPEFELLNTAPADAAALVSPEQAPSVFEVLSGVSAASEALATEPAAAAAKPRRKLTVEEKIAALEARIVADTAKIKQLREDGDTDAKLAGVKPGSVVVVKLGRKFSEEKDTTRFVQATVVAIKDEDDVQLYKVQYGEGWEAEVAVVRGVSITEVVSLGE